MKPKREERRRTRARWPSEQRKVGRRNKKWRSKESYGMLVVCVEFIWILLKKSVDGDDADEEIFSGGYFAVCTSDQ